VHLYVFPDLVHKVDEPEELLARILDEAVRILGAERGMVLLESPGGTGLVPAAVRGLDEVTLAEAAGYSHAAVREAMAGRPVVSLDVGADPRLAGLRSVSLHSIRTLACVPLTLPDRILGVLYIDSRRVGPALDADDLRFLGAFAAQAALAIESARLHQRLREENRTLSRQARDRHSYEDLIGRTPAMQAVYDLLDRAAQSSLPVLLLGETGTGKELAARALHRRGPRRTRPFLAANCAAFTDTLLESELFGHVRGAFTGAETDRRGLFELCQGGILFLDEIAGMSPGMQAKLLRVLEDGEFRPLGAGASRRADVRIVAATHADLDRLVAQGGFREDLFYRLNVIRIVMPPLRARVEDIPLLVAHFVARSKPAGGAAPPEFEPAALREMASLPWMGNARELEHVVQRALLAAQGSRLDLPTLRGVLPRRASGLPTPAGGFPSLREIEIRQIGKTLEACRWNREEAARRLGIGRATVYRKIREYGLTPPPESGGGHRAGKPARSRLPPHA
jgi:Nif-specific regulatory protein